MPGFHFGFEGVQLCQCLDTHQILSIGLLLPCSEQNFYSVSINWVKNAWLFKEVLSGVGHLGCFPAGREAAACGTQDPGP